MSEHSLLSPSSAHRRVRCLGSLAACRDAPNETNEYAAEGTAYHEIAANALKAGLRTPGLLDEEAACQSYIGHIIEVDGFKFTIDQDNATHAQTYVDHIRALPGILLVEVKLDTSSTVGVDGQGGTGDAVVLDFEHRTIHVVDLKFGRGEIVYAKDNEQLLEYGSAALMMYGALGAWEFVKVAIHQPRIGHYDDWTYTIPEIQAWVRENQPKEKEAYRLYKRGSPAEVRANLTPGEKQCLWCPIRGSCAARSEAILAQFPVSPITANLQMTDNELAAARDRVEEIAQWCSDIQAEALRRALIGRTIPGWKIVIGKKGARKWSDEGIVEPKLVEALGDKAYATRKIITAAVAEKELKKLPAAWATLQAFIDQPDGNKSLERESDPREAQAVATVEFKLTT